MKILAIDFEGTSKEPRRGAPCQLGVAVMEGQDVLASAEWIIAPPVHWKTGKPTREVDAYALRISGLTLEQIEAGNTAGEACYLLQRFVGEHNAGSLPIVAYNISYDVECYGQMLFDGGWYDRGICEYLAYPEILGPTWKCAYRLARRLLGSQLYRFDLDTVAGHFGMARSGEAHGALEDAILAGRVFDSLMTLALGRQEPTPITYCPVCGHVVHLEDDDPRRQCPNCETEFEVPVSVCAERSVR